MNKTTTMIAKHEGHNIDEHGRHIVYKDSLGLDTIGYGRLLSRGLNGAEALFLLENDVSDHRNELIVHAPWVQSLDEVRQAVLIDMAFNLGVPGLMRFKNMLDACRKGDWHRAMIEMRYKDRSMNEESLWHQQTGTRAIELEDMMITGEW